MFKKQKKLKQKLKIYITKVIHNKRIQFLNYNPCEFLAANNAWLK